MPVWVVAAGLIAAAGSAYASYRAETATDEASAKKWRTISTNIGMAGMVAGGVGAAAGGAGAAAGSEAGKLAAQETVKQGLTEAATQTAKSGLQRGLEAATTQPTLTSSLSSGGSQASTQLGAQAGGQVASEGGKQLASEKLSLMKPLADKFSGSQMLQNAVDKAAAKKEMANKTFDYFKEQAGQQVEAQQADSKRKQQEDMQAQQRNKALAAKAAASRQRAKEILDANTVNYTQPEPPLGSGLAKWDI